MIDDQRRVGVAGIRAVDQEDGALARLDRQVDARHGGDAGAAGPGGAKHLPRRMGRAGAERHAGDPVALAVQAHDLIGGKDRATGDGGGAKAVQKAHIVEPALIAGAEAARDDIVEGHPGEAPGKRVAVQNLGRGAKAALHGGDLLHHRPARLRPGQEEIAILLQAQRRHAALWPDEVAEVADDVDAEA